jgi:hypothetical protein
MNENVAVASGLEAGVISPVVANRNRIGPDTIAPPAAKKLRASGVSEARGGGTRRKYKKRKTQRKRTHRRR